MKRVDIKNPYLYLNSAITLCYFTIAVFLFDGLAHFVVGATISVSFVWYFYGDWIKRPQVHLLPLWAVLSIWFCLGEFENAVFASSSSIAVRDLLWMVLVGVSYVDKIFGKSPLTFQIGWGLFLASGIALSTTDSLARRMGMLTMSYKVSICICMYTACELRSNLKKNKLKDETKFNVFQSSWVLFCWNSLSILAMIQLIYLVYEVVSGSTGSIGQTGSIGSTVPQHHYSETIETSTPVSASSYPSSPFSAQTEYRPVMREYSTDSSDSSNPGTPFVGGSPFHHNIRRTPMSFRNTRQVWGRAAYTAPPDFYESTMDD